MRLARFSVDGKSYSGLIDCDLNLIFELSGGDMLGAPAGHGELRIEQGERNWPLEEVRLLSPVLPSKIVAIGLNFKAHAAEFNLDIPEEPGFFLKPPTSVVGPGEEIVYPVGISRRVDFEAELGVVISKTSKDVDIEDVPSVILGYTCFNDVTARDLQGRDIQWARSKSFDTFAPMGPWIETDLDTSDLSIECELNGESRQQSSTSDMIFNVAELVSFLSSMMTLLPGDVIATGTPSGVAKMKPGDSVTVRVEGIGELTNTVTE